VFGERSIQLARVAGIRVGASLSWFLFLGIAIWFGAGWFEDRLGSDGGSTAFIAAVAAAFLYFGSIVLHELGHAFEARRNGIDVEGVDLWIFGGLARLSRDSKTPGEEFKVAVAGPLANLLIILVCLAVTAALVGTDRTLEVASLSDNSTISAVELVIGFTATMNFLILVFNLVPAFPLDGGRIARAAVWRITGDRNRGTVVSAWLGQGSASCSSVWGRTSGSSPTTPGARSGRHRRLAHHRGRPERRRERAGVRSPRGRDRRRHHGRTSTDDARDHPPDRRRGAVLRPHDAPWIAVVDDGGRLLGIAERERVREAIDAGRPVLESRDVLTPGEPVGTDQPLEAVIRSEPLTRLGAVMAVDGRASSGGSSPSSRCGEPRRGDRLNRLVSTP
jgi:Zn-dependent protease